MARPKTAPTLTEYVLREAHYTDAEWTTRVRREFRALLAVARAAEHDHDERFREIANEDHSACPVCRALSRLRAASTKGGRS